MDGALWTIIAAALAWGAAVPMKGIRRILLLLAAPVILTSGAPAGLNAMSLAAATGLAILGLAPLIAELGLSKPPVRAFIGAVGVAWVPLLFALTPPGRVIISSDLGLGATIVLLAAGLLVASALAARTKAS